MRKLAFIVGLLGLGAGMTWGQSAEAMKNGISNDNFRNSNTIAFPQNYQSRKVSAGLSLRIEEGKIWVNGNLVPTKDLPASLHNLDNAIFYQASVAGLNEMTFLVNDREYLVRDGKIVELEVPSPIGDNTTSNSGKQRAAEAYYSQLKRESPGLFYGLSREGALYEQCRSLLLEYQIAQGKQRDKIREEIRLVLGQLFDINERNRELEIRQLEQMIDAAKKEVEFRKTNKSLIIDNTLDDLLEE